MDDFEERVRRRAHRMWQEEGCPEGRAEVHWDKARELVAIEDNHKLTLQPIIAGTEGPTGEPIEPIEAVENAGEFPTPDRSGRRANLSRTARARPDRVRPFVSAAAASLPPTDMRHMSGARLDGRRADRSEGEGDEISGPGREHRLVADRTCRGAAAKRLSEPRHQDHRDGSGRRRRRYRHAASSARSCGKNGVSRSSSRIAAAPGAISEPRPRSPRSPTAIR